MSSPAHALTFEKVVEDLGANADTGLTADEAKKRLEEFGNNEFGGSEAVQPIKIFVGQLANALTLVSEPSLRTYLCTASAISRGLDPGEPYSHSSVRRLCSDRLKRSSMIP